MSKTALSPDEAAAHMYPSDLKKFEFGEHVEDAFSIAVGCPGETSVPLFTTTQAEAYADARVRGALEIMAVEAHQACINYCNGHATNFEDELKQALRALIPPQQ